MNYRGQYVDQARRTIGIRQVTDSDMPFRIRVTLPDELDAKLRAHPDYPFEIEDELKGWICHDEPAGEYLKVEAGKLGIAGAGPTLDLRPLTSDTLLPSVSMGLYDDWEDDLGIPWALPLSSYHRCTMDGSNPRE
jgi:hypothetical protein